MNNKKKTIKMIDVPMGWACGFPKPFPEDVQDVKKWLLDNGYPKSLMASMGDDFSFRIFESPNHKNKK